MGMMDSGFSGILPANGIATPQMLERKRRLAEAMMQQGTDTSPIASPWQGAARLANALMGGLSMRRADKQEQAGRKTAQESLMAAMTGGGNDASLMGAMNDPWMSESGQGILQNQWKQNHTKPDPMAALDMEYKRAQLDKLRMPDPTAQALTPDQLKSYSENGYADPSGTVHLPEHEKAASIPTSVEEFNFAKSQGFKGSYMDYEKEKRGKGMTVYDPNTGQPIMTTGDTSMNGTSIPSEVGARIGLGQEFLQNDYNPILKSIRAGEVTGVGNYAAGSFGRGAPGEVHRRMASGADALKRALTGAGMSVAESNDYASRYQPVWSDDAATLERKLIGLKSDLEAVANGAIKGKAGHVSDLLPTADAPAKVLTFNPSTGKLE